MRIGFVTCVELGLACIEEIYANGYSINLAITLEDELAKKKSGRVYLDKSAEHHGFDLLKIKDINDDDAISTIKRCQLDWLFIVGWSQIVNREVLQSTKYGAIGAHPTLLPRGRGRAAIPWAIIKGLPETGVTVFKIDEGVDTGPVLGQVHIPMSKTVNARQLYDQVANAHKKIILDTVERIQNDNVQLAEQDESLATYWPKRTPSDGEINLNGSVIEAERLIRATTHPYPGAFMFQNGKKVIVWRASFEPQANTLFEIVFKDGTLYVTESDFCSRVDHKLR